MLQQAFAAVSVEQHRKPPDGSGFFNQMNRDVNGRTISTAKS